MSSIPSDGYVILIGAMKSGTTSLYSYLAAHPEICECVRKEPEYFSDARDRVKNLDWYTNQKNPFYKYRVQNLRWYASRRKRFPNYADLWNYDPNRHVYALEASTGYTKFPHEASVPERMHNYGIRPKFVYLVRDPFERIESHFSHMKRISPRFDTSQTLASETFIAYSNYFVQLNRFRDFFPKESFLIVDFDDLKRDAATVVGQVNRFLGVSNGYVPTSFQIRNSDRPIFRHESTVCRRPGLYRSAMLLPAPLRNCVKKGLRTFIRPEERRRLTTQEREVIRSALWNDMRQLKLEYGVEVGKWGFN